MTAFIFLNLRCPRSFFSIDTGLMIFYAGETPSAVVTAPDLLL
ncbi:MAG: hypothetical protein R3C41_22400 [Calditrichia bacterium]